MKSRAILLLVLPLTLALGGCPGQDKPEPEIRYVPVAATVKPAAAAVCFRRSPAKPVPRGKDNTDLVAAIDAFDTRANTVDGMRDECAADLRAKGLGPGK